MSTTLSYSTFGAAMAGNDTVGAHARRHTHHQVIMKMLVSGAIALGVWVGVAAPASADVRPSMGNGITNAELRLIAAVLADRLPHRG